MLTLVIARTSSACTHASSDARITEGNSESFDVFSKGVNILIALQPKLEIFQLLTLLLLNLQSDLHHPVKELCNLLKVGIGASASCHRWRANTHAARRQSGGISVDTVPV